jgi:protein tyrosine phosphatase (PTP) superfamily phosphohydrolase (DUF442 family)
MRHWDRLAMRLVCLCPLLAVGCEAQQEAVRNEIASPTVTASTRTETAAERSPEKLVTHHLPNVVRVHERVLSGGLPEGEAAFAELRKLGVQTIISVDGARPDVDLATRFGMHYVHLPHGYSGIPDVRVQELAKAVLELKGPVYIHCHHGKHRSPAAASAACITAGLLSVEHGSDVLQIAGTSPHYRGLFQAVAASRTVPEGELKRLAVTFVPIAPVPPLAEAMVLLEETYDPLKHRLTASASTLDSAAILELTQEALLLHEHFTELLRLEEVATYPDAFRDALRRSEAAAGELETGLSRLGEEPQRSPTTLTDATIEPLRRSLRTVSEQCKACHEQFRDLPQLPESRSSE